jgi:hypothetical protein
MTRVRLHLVPNAQASPVCEATVPGPTSSSSAIPSRWNRTFQPVARLLTVARQRAASFLDLVALSQIRLAKEIVAKVPSVMETLFGDDFEYFEGEWCAVCADVHPAGTNCPRALIGVCEDCNDWRDLDRFGMCPVGHKSISKRTQKHQSTYMRNLTSASVD